VKKCERNEYENHKKHHESWFGISFIKVGAFLTQNSTNETIEKGNKDGGGPAQCDGKGKIEKTMESSVSSHFFSDSGPPSRGNGIVMSPQTKSKQGYGQIRYD
ncbi:MAG: hypothetical protein JRN15_23450, partial [Nitrososphaerota archaeon]|nr:hypothetical protein [Nitrososphaerota archaeon]